MINQVRIRLLSETKDDEVPDENEAIKTLQELWIV